MFGFSFQFIDKTKDLKKAVDDTAFRNQFHAAASIRKTAAQSIERAPQGQPSSAGSPPHTHRRVFYRRALAFHVDKQKQEALIGFRHSVIGDVGAVHEFGNERGGVRYPERPTLGPALEASLGRIAGQWKASLGTAV